MVLTKDELIATLQHEVRIFTHLLTKVDRGKLDYRPTPKQRSTIELIRYMSYMAPTLAKSIQAGGFDVPTWTAANAAAEKYDLDAATAAIAKQSDELTQLIGSMSDQDLRSEIEMFGRKGSRGHMMVNIIAAGFAAYRTQLFLYLKSCGRDELNTFNLWAGMDGTM